VPGEIFSALSAGTNALLRQGAPPLLEARDVLDALGLEPAAAVAPPLSDAGEATLALLRDAPAGVDDLVARTGCAAADVSAALVELELAGLAGQADGVYRALGSTIAA
jgi:DNA processing protein